MLLGPWDHAARLSRGSSVVLDVMMRWPRRYHNQYFLGIAFACLGELVFARSVTVSSEAMEPTSIFSATRSSGRRRQGRGWRGRLEEEWDTQHCTWLELRQSGCFHTSMYAVTDLSCQKICHRELSNVFRMNKSVKLRHVCKKTARQETTKLA